MGPEFSIEDDTLYFLKPIHCGKESYAEKIPIITKDVFITLYKLWIKGEEEKDE